MRTALMLLLLISTSMMIYFNVMLTTASPAEIYVPGDYSKIQWAIGNASDGDTIIVQAGTYREQLVINKSLTLQGQAGAIVEAPDTRNTYTVAESSATFDPIIFAYGGTESGGAVSGAGTRSVNITGFEIDGRNNATAAPNRFVAILLRNINPGVLSDNTVHDLFDSDGEGNGPRTFGILVLGDSEVTINNNDVSEFSRGGICAFGDDDALPPDPIATIEDNVVLGNGLEVDTDWLAENGIHIDFDASGSIINNNVSQCIVNDPYWGASGILAWYEEIDILGNNVTDCDYGIAIGEASCTVLNNVVSGCHRDDMSAGIALFDAFNNTIKHNTIDDNDYGIWMDGDSDNNQIVGNAILSNTIEGIHIEPYGGADPSGTKAHYNNIVGNTNAGLNKTGSETVDARFNWWGDSTGPYHPTLNPTGLGDEVSDNVTFTNYLTEPFTTLLYTDPDPIQKAPSAVCTYFNVSIVIENVTDLFGFDLNITWDNTLITVNRCYYNDTLNAMWGVGNWYIPKNQTGPGWYKLVAVSTSTGFTSTGSQILFYLEFHVASSGCNFLLETPIDFEVVKLSNSYWTSIPATVDDGLYQISGTVPDLEFVLVQTPPFEYCDSFEVEVWVTHICANLTDYNFTILFNDELLNFVDVNDWGVLGNMTHDNANYMNESGKIHVWDTGGSVFNSGNGSLFTLTFHVQFNDTIDHIWRTCGNQNLTAQISFEDAELSFEEGIIEMGGITIPPPLEITITLIRGDVDCNGIVNVFDLRTIAAYYDESAPVKYDLNCDGTIDIFDLVITATNYGYGT
jgi:parallel beta-helix repeat protein